jgi:hypothetical protein
MADRIVRGQPLRLFVLFFGEAVDAAGQVEVDYDIAIHEPDGRTVERKNLVAIPRRRLDPRFIQSAQTGIAYEADPSDPLGEYRVHVVAFDRVGHNSAVANASFRVIDPESAGGLPANFDPISWISGFYRDPKPLQALPALMAFSHTPFGRGPVGRLGPLLGFMEQVLGDDPWLAPRFNQRFATTADPDERRLLGFVLAYAYRNKPEFTRELPGPARRLLADVPLNRMPVPSAEPLSGAQLDIYWGRFFASGSAQPIRDLVAVVRDYLPFQGSLDAYRRLTVKPDHTPVELYKNAVLNAAMWSLASNARQHDLVRAYLAFIFEGKDTPPAVKSALKAILLWKPKGQPTG